MNKISVVILISVGILLIALGNSKAASPNTETNEQICKKTESKLKQSGPSTSCLLCCAENGYNRFDSQAFQTIGTCRCYKDLTEIQKNSVHKQRPNGNSATTKKPATNNK